MPKLPHKNILHLPLEISEKTFKKCHKQNNCGNGLAFILGFMYAEAEYKQEDGMENKRGIIYILTNPMYHDDVIKIGSTTNLVRRIKQLDRKTGVPCPFECYVAYEIDNYKEAEDLMHRIYRSVERNTDKEHKNKEFYQVYPSKADDILSRLADLLNGNKVTVDSNQIYTKQQQQLLEKHNHEAQKKQIAKRFKFQNYNIPVGATLTFIKNEKTTCLVQEDNKVNYKGQSYSLSGLTLELMKKLGYTAQSYNGYAYWLYNDMILTDLIPTKK